MVDGLRDQHANFFFDSTSTSFTAGLRLRAMMTSSPLSAAAMSLEMLVLAWWMLTSMRAV
jgi:hypothetical protein